MQPVYGVRHMRGREPPPRECGRTLGTRALSVILYSARNCQNLAVLCSVKKSDFFVFPLAQAKRLVVRVSRQRGQPHKPTTKKDETMKKTQFKLNGKDSTLEEISKEVRAYRHFGCRIKNVKVRSSVGFQIFDDGAWKPFATYKRVSS